MAREREVTTEAVIESLRLPAWQVGVRATLQRYGDALGVEALLRQLELDKKRWRCCWEAKDGPHHPLCRAGGDRG